MGLFKKIKKKLKKTAAKVVKNPARGAFAVFSLGTTEALRKAPVIGKTFRTGFDKGFAPAYQIGADYVTGGKFSLAQGLAQHTLVKGDTVGFNLGGFLGAAGQILSSTQGGNAGGVRAFGNVLTMASAATAPKYPAMAKRPQLPNPMKGPLNGPKLAGGGAITSLGRAVGRTFFQKYPNLATAIQKFRNAGMTQVTRGRLYQLLKRFGPELIISGGILTAAAVSELMMAGPGYRRMNPANVKALRRSVRRLEGFHKLCVHVDKLRKPRSRGCKTRGGSTQFVRQG